MPKYTPSVPIPPGVVSAVEKEGIPLGNRFTRRVVERGQKRRDKGKMRGKQAAQDAPVDIYEGLGYCLSLFSAHMVEYELPYMSSSGEMKSDRTVFMTGEHAYQASKFTDVEVIQEIIYARSPAEAKAVAHRNQAKYRPDWSAQTKLRVYEAVARAKAEQHAEVRDVLKKTIGRKIIESSPVDDFWGLGCDKTGRNNAGKIWMKIRSDFFQA